MSTSGPEPEMEPYADRSHYRIRTDDQFKDGVKLYVEIVDELAATSKKASALRKHKAELSESIMGYMRNEDLEELDLESFGGGKLLRRKSKRVEGLKKDAIIEQLGVMLGNSGQAETVVSNIWNNRAVSETETLRRTRPRAS